MRNILLMVLASIAASAVHASPVAHTKYAVAKPGEKNFFAQEQVKWDPDTCPYKQAREQNRVSRTRVQASISGYLRSGTVKTEVPRIRTARSAK